MSGIKLCSPIEVSSTLALKPKKGNAGNLNIGGHHSLDAEQRNGSPGAVE